MSKLFRHGRVYRQGRTEIRGRGLRGDGIVGDGVLDIVGETKDLVKYTDGSIMQKPLLQRFGEKSVGLDIRQNLNKIQPFSQIKAPTRVPLSSASINVQNSPEFAHVGKAVGQAKSQIKRLFGGKGVETKNNIRLVL